jgi:hypothetical protein
VVLLLAFAVGLGIAAVRRIGYGLAGLAGLAVFAVIGAAAAIHLPAATVADGIHTWRQWMWVWDAKPGLHTLQVRATDNSGATQTSQRAYPVPNGASGWDSVVVTVT